MIRRHPAEMLQRIKHCSLDDIGISSITMAELSFGAAAYGGLRATLESRGAGIGALDTLIGA